MPTNAELTAKVTDLELEKATLQSTLDSMIATAETLQNELDTVQTLEVTSDELVPEETKTLFWAHNANTIGGIIPTAYGYTLTPVDNYHTAEVPVSRVEVELTRGGNAFTDKRPEAVE